MLGALLLWTLVVDRPYVGPEAVASPEARALAVELAIEVAEPRGRLGELVWAPDGRSVWVVGGASLFRVQADTGAVIGRLDVPDGDAADGLAISSRGHLAATTRDDFVTVWNGATGDVALRVSRRGWMLDGLVAFSPDGKQVFAAFYGDDPRHDEAVRIEAWDVASGRSLGKRRVPEVSLWSTSVFEFEQVRLAGKRVYFDDLVLFVRPHEIRACGDELPYATAGALAWYEGGGVRRMDDCSVVYADTSALERTQVSDVQLTARGDRAAYYRRDAKDVKFGVIDLAANAELAQVEYGDVSGVPGFAIAPDGSQVAATLTRSGPDGEARQFLLLWRPLAVGAAPARVLALRVPLY